MPLVPIEIDCTPKCRSTTHYLDLIRIASQSIPVPIILNYLHRCGFCSKGHDKYGRTLIHVCAALSDKWPVIEWLLKQKKVDISWKNLESGYTPLHYSVFYGRIDNAVNLIKAGANTTLFDYDHLTYIDHVIRDTLVESNIDQSQFESYEVYTMGENTNGNLGHSQSTAKKVPELIDVFRRDSICIKQVKIDKYHTLFLAENGSVYSCGFGVGGRLGHDNEEPVLIPKQIIGMELIKEIEQDRCVDIEITRDCSYFLTEKGSLWSCGLNNYHQLGHPGVQKVLTPTKIQFRQLKDRKVTHVACGRFHCAVLVDDGQLYTFGLNAGHLGHIKGADQFIIQPCLVTKFNSREEFVQKLVCSDAAILCYTNKGDIYLLNEYKCRRIVKHILNITELTVVGGKLESMGVLDEENVDDDLKVFYIQSKKLYLYHDRESNSGGKVSKLCMWVTKQRLLIEHLAAGTNAIMFSTNTGQVYTANLDKLSNPNKKNEYDPPSSSTSIYDERAYQYLTPLSVPLLHRCRALSTDRKGRSLAALQYHPNTHLTAYPRQPESTFNSDMHQLLEEAEHTHDIILKLNNQHSFPAHKYILAMRSAYFRDLIYNNKNNIRIDQLSLDDGLNSTDPEMFFIILEYIYSDMCPWLNLVKKIKTREEHEYQMYLARTKNVDDHDDHRYFARIRQQTAAVVTQQQQGTKSKKKKKGVNTSSSDLSSNELNDIQQQRQDELSIGLEQLLDLARRFQLKSLRQRLEIIKQSRQNQKNSGNDDSVGQLARRFQYYSREALSELHDVTIVAEDGRKLSCHKCILTSRLDYFRSMFLADWMESQNTSELKMAIPFDLLEIIIDYLYTDNLTSKFTIEQLCQILVLADQLLIERLKQICEFHITNLVTFREAGELLQFASAYNADQLKIFVAEFICRNMATFLEARMLDNLDNQLLIDLTRTYRNLLDCMNYRMITPYSDCPSLDEIPQNLDELENLSIDIDETTMVKKQSMQQKRKQQNKLRTSESENNSKSSPPTPVDETPNTISPNRPKRRDEDEKWTAVSSKKTPKGGKAAQTPTLTNGALPIPIRPTIPGAVYTQQEADKLAAAKRAADQEVATVKPIIKTVAPQQRIEKPSLTTNDESVPKNPWKTAGHHPSSVAPPLKVSFQTENLPKPTMTRPTPIPHPARSIPIVQPSPPSQHDVTNPWSSLTAASPPSFAYMNASMASSPPIPPMSFKHIQDEETRAHQALRQLSNKSLEIIQTEELAIQALHRLYHSDQEFDMCITVERVLPEIANPIWPRTTPTSTSSTSSIVLVTQKRGAK